MEFNGQFNFYLYYNNRFWPTCISIINPLFCINSVSFKKKKNGLTICDHFLCVVHSIVINSKHFLNLFYHILTVWGQMTAGRLTESAFLKVCLTTSFSQNVIKIVVKILLSKMLQMVTTYN